MIRKDALYMIKSDWEPKVPNEKIIKEQISNAGAHIAGNVRFGLSKIAVKKTIKNK